MRNLLEKLSKIRPFQEEEIGKSTNSGVKRPCDCHDCKNIEFWRGTDHETTLICGVTEKQIDDPMESAKNCKYWNNKETEDESVLIKSALALLVKKIMEEKHFVEHHKLGEVWRVSRRADPSADEWWGKTLSSNGSVLTYSTKAAAETAAREFFPDKFKQKRS